MIATVAAIAAIPAWAEISEDLRFCAQLKAPKERLACYDAAARIEHRKPAFTAGPGLVEKQAAAVPSRSRFSGAYVGVVGGYDIASESALPNPIIGYVPCAGAATPNAPGGAVQGPSVGFLAGYNVVERNLLLGLEARGRYSFAKASDTVLWPAYSNILPIWIGSCSPCSPDRQMISTDRVTLSSALSNTAVYRRPFAADVSVRAGYALSEWLLYAKAGIGVEKTESYSLSDDSKSVYCNNPTIKGQRLSGDYVGYYAVACGSQSNGVITRFELLNGYAPAALLGGGIERNFNALFLRAEAELIGHATPGTGWTFYYTPSVNLVAGYRF
ncbi:hypothetical protein [Bradyrhizobium sp. BR 10289]|uniref:hypothetical protein n=1 Tax=Bradyrhizobium sp. BR 10289 TaxID=2749993 RepID=UPI001C644EDD|nr:hypothetical protein [Bradyrhizobium sp. BR 10289]MBW7970104.1 hypothetical protein [Bradyrhizobium sp. BR 10289]